jgi:hypothetical protein
MRLLDIFALLIVFTAGIACMVFVLIACGGSKRKYEKFTQEELRKLEEFRKDR